MTQRRILFFLLLAALAFGGCFHRHKVKESPITTQTEDSFRQRWIAKRMSDLQASGKAADARQARIMANDDFRKQFPYTGVANQTDPFAGSTP